MPERLDRPVTIARDGGEPVIPWSDRQALTRRLQHVKAHNRIRSAFDAVGATRRVELTNVQRSKLLYVLDEWSLGLDRYDEPMPEVFDTLRFVLRLDLHDAEQRG
jgi:hypothetical protein